MIFTDYVPDYVIPTAWISFPHSSYGSLSIDLNKDNVDDLEIHKAIGGGLAATYTSYVIVFKNQNYLMTKLDSSRTFYNGDSTSSEPFNPYAKKFNVGDSLISIIDSAWTNDSTYIESLGVGGGSTTLFTDYILPTDAPYYYFLKIITATDTLLGYLHFTTDGGQLLDFACEGPTSSHIISSTNDLSSSNISISPNPFTFFINISSEKPFKYSISDYIGRLVKQGESYKTIETDALASGNYILTIKNEERFSVKKIVKY